jgi:hypothetical protein
LGCQFRIEKDAGSEDGTGADYVLLGDNVVYLTFEKVLHICPSNLPLIVKLEFEALVVGSDFKFAIRIARLREVP